MTTYYTKDHEYIRVEGDTGTVGISDYAQSQLGDVVFVELPAVGKTLTKGAEAAVVESVKRSSPSTAPSRRRPPRSTRIRSATAGS
jgi:glycine cleavage system H protein